MIIFKLHKDFHQHLQAVLKINTEATLGFVPTMGALHNGHISLIKESINNNTYTCCSIFINPTQFNDSKDFEKYPVTLENDVLLLERAGCDFLFLPSVSEMYPTGTSNLEHYELGFVETILEGAFRPGHYQGVCQIVYRLLSMVTPHNLYLGQKDFQQCMVITKMIDITDLKGKVSVNICATLREQDGLAMSSRNIRLNAQERQLAVNISKVLLSIKAQYKNLAFSILEKEATQSLINAGFKVDYVAICNAEDLNQQDQQAQLGKAYVALVAAFCGEVRLIDNMVL